MTDFPDDEETRAFLREAQETMGPMMRDSAVALSILPDDKGGAKYWVELGAAIMYEKPIMLLVVEGRPIPQKLQRVVDEIVVVPRGPATEWPSSVGEEIEAAVKRMHGAL